MPSLYETDFFTWTLEQSELIRKGELTAIDSANLAEEIFSMGASELRSLENYYIVLIKHLLKQKYQPEKATRSWEFSIRNAKNRISRLLRKNPGMKQHLSEIKTDAYDFARLEAASETGLDEKDFPEEADEWMRQKLEEK